MNIFEEGTKRGVRYATTNGVMCIEDLWHLELSVLNNIAMGINKKIKESNEESFIVTKSPVDTLEILKLDIAVHIIQYKMAEAEKKKAAKERAEKRARLKELIGIKIRNTDEEKSLDQLQEELAELDRD